MNRSELDAPIEWSHPYKKQTPDWDAGTKVKFFEPGTVEEIKERLLALLQQAIIDIESYPDVSFQYDTPSWPFTRIGLKLHKAIHLCEAVAERYTNERL